MLNSNIGISLFAEELHPLLVADAFKFKVFNMTSNYLQ